MTPLRNLLEGMEFSKGKCVFIRRLEWETYFYARATGWENSIGKERVMVSLCELWGLGGMRIFRGIVGGGFYNRGMEVFRGLHVESTMYRR